MFDFKVVVFMLYDLATLAGEKINKKGSIWCNPRPIIPFNLYPLNGACFVDGRDRKSCTVPCGTPMGENGA